MSGGVETAGGTGVDEMVGAGRIRPRAGIYGYVDGDEV